MHAVLARLERLTKAATMLAQLAALNGQIIEAERADLTGVCDNAHAPVHQAEGYLGGREITHAPFRPHLTGQHYSSHVIPCTTRCRRVANSSSVILVLSNSTMQPMAGLHSP